MTNYIFEYYQAITDGSVTVGKWVRDWYALVVDGLNRKRWFFDIKKATKAVNFIERFCHHHEGQLAPGLITLELWQKAFISIVFGVLDAEGLRQFREVMLVVGRKNGKTLLAAAITAYMLFIDGEYGARIYFCAPKLDQARLCYDALYQMIQKEPTMSGYTKKRRTDLYVAQTNSSAMPLAFSARKSDGLNISMCVCDELGAWHGDAGLKQYEVLKSSQGSRKQPLIVSITTANFQHDGIYDEMMKRCTAVIMGNSQETRLAPFLYIIDDADKWNDINELQKSMPNLGVSVSVDYMLSQLAVAEGSISKATEFKCKYCNLQQNSSSAWVSAQTVAKGFQNHYTLEDFRNTYALAGLDLSMTTDLSAAVVMIERDGILHYFTHFWLPSALIDDAIARDGVPYRKYIEKGWLSLSGQNYIDYQDIFAWFRMLIEQYQIYPLITGYDKWSATYLVEAMKQYGFRMDSVKQGTNLTGVINNTYGMLLDGSLQCGDQNDLMKIHLLDAAMKTYNDSGLKKLIKVNAHAHVDGVASLLDAMCMRQVYLNEYGEQLKNQR